MVTVHAGMTVEGESIMFVSLGKHLGCAVEKGQLAFVVGVVYVGTAGTHLGVGDDLQNVR